MLRHITNQKVGQRDKYEHKRKDLFENQKQRQCKDKENANIKKGKDKIQTKSNRNRKFNS